MKYKTRYTSIVSKGSVGQMIESSAKPVRMFLLEFENGESYWFLKRDLIEIEEDE